MTNHNVDYFTDNFVISGLAFALFLCSLFFITYNSLIIIFLIIALAIGYLIGYNAKCKRPERKPISNNDRNINISLEKEFEVIYRLYTDYEKLMTDRTNIFLLVYTFLFAAFFQLLILKSDKNNFIASSLSDNNIIYLEYVLSIFGFILALIHLYILSDTGNKYRKIKIVLRDFEEQNNIIITTKFDMTKPIIGITIGYRLIPLIVMLIWFVVGIFLIPDYTKVGTVIPLENSISEVINIFVYFIGIFVIMILMIRLLDFIIYRGSDR